MRIEMWPIDRPIDYPKNARKWSQAAIDKVTTSLREFGFRQPIVVDKHDVIIIGHLRRVAARAAGFKQVPVHVADLPAGKVRQLRLMDNRSHDEAQWDLDILAEEMAELSKLDLDLSFTGFDEREYVSFMAGSGLTDPDEVPEAPAIPVTQAGDLWLMGDHRLLCGDSTDAVAVARLMGGEKAGVIMTDPSYGISADSMTLGTGKKKFHRSGFDSDRGDVVWLLNLAPLVCIWGGNYFSDVLPITNDWLCWHKKNDGISFSEFELAWTNFGKNTRLLSHHWAGEVKLHPTMKPVTVIEWALGFAPSGLVFDPYIGSGSTLIACEKAPRSCYGVELSPDYCDVIVTRWQNFTGKVATLDGDGRTFAEIAAERAA